MGSSSLADTLHWELQVLATGHQGSPSNNLTELIFIEQSRHPWWLSGKESTCNAGDTHSNSRSGRSPGEENGSTTIKIIIIIIIIIII